MEFLHGFGGNDGVGLGFLVRSVPLNERQAATVRRHERHFAFFEDDIDAVEHIPGLVRGNGEDGLFDHFPQESGWNGDGFFLGELGQHGVIVFGKTDKNTSVPAGADFNLLSLSHFDGKFPTVFQRAEKFVENAGRHRNGSGFFNVGFNFTADADL